MSSSSSKTSQARLREALTAGGASNKERGPPVADGVLSVTPDTAEAIEWRSRRSVVDSIAACSPVLDDDDEGAVAAAAAGGGVCCSWALGAASRAASLAIGGSVGVQRTRACKLPELLFRTVHCCHVHAATRSTRLAAALLAAAAAACCAGVHTCELYGKFTWKLEKFGESGKRELRSNVFEVGGFKWCVPAVPGGRRSGHHLSQHMRCRLGSSAAMCAR